MLLPHLIFLPPSIFTLVLPTPTLICSCIWTNLCTTPTFPKTRPPQRQSKTSYTRQSQWLRSSLYKRRNTPVKEHILPSSLTAATTSSIKIHRLYCHFDHPLSLTYIQESFDYNLCYLTSTEIYCLHCRFSHPSAKKLYRVLKHSRSARNSNSAMAMAISTKAVPVKAYWSVRLIKQAYLA